MHVKHAVSQWLHVNCDVELSTYVAAGHEAKHWPSKRIGLSPGQLVQLLEVGPSQPRQLVSHRKHAFWASA